VIFIVDLNHDLNRINPDKNTCYPYLTW